RPEQRLGFPSAGKDIAMLSDADKAGCFRREIEYVLVHSSTARHIDMDVAAELLAGKRSRMSFAPMVIATGNLMAFEAAESLLGPKRGAVCRGYFSMPWSMRTERPLAAPLAWAKAMLVRRFPKRMRND